MGLALYSTRRLSVAFLTAAGWLAVAAMAQAQVTWDSSFSTTGPQDGSGTWSTSASGTNWWNGTANVAWSSGNIATFGAGGTAATVTVSGSVNVAGLAFGNIATGSSGPRYTLSSGTIGFTDNGTISLSGSSGLFNAGVNIGSRLIANNLSVTSSGPFIPNGSQPQAVGLILGGSNTITGTLSLSGPMLLGSPTALTQNNIGTAVIDVSNGANFSGGLSNYTNDFRIAGNGSGRGAIRIQTNATGLQPGGIYSGSITLTGSAQIWGNSGHNATFLQGFGETAGGSKRLEFSNLGVLFLRGVSSYTGTTSITAGSVVLDGGNNTLSSQTVLSMSVSQGSSSRLVLGGTTNGAMSQAVSGLISSATNVSIVAGTSSLSTLAVTVASGANTFAGMLGGTAANENNLTFTKSGAGTLTLTGTQNTYAGNTTISGGTLALGANATMANTPVITVGNAGSSGAVLDLTAKTGTFTFGSNQTVAGIGTINFGAGKTVASQGVWAPGNSIGSNAVTGNLALSGTSQFELGTPGSSASSPGTSDFTAVSGTLTLGGTLVLLDNSGSNSQGSYGAGSYRLFTAPALSGTFASVTAPAGATTTRVGMVYTAGTASGQGVFANVYNLASANTLSGSINLGTVLTGAVLAQNLSITNTAPNDGYSEKLDAAFGPLAGNATTNSGSISLLGAQATNGSSMSIGLDSATAGAKSGSVQVNFTSNGAGTSGLGTLSLAPQTVNLAATVLDPATALLVSGSTSGSNWLVNLGEFQQASGTSSLVSFGISNLTQTADYTADLFLASFATSTDSGAIFTDLTGTSAFTTLQSGGTNSFAAWMSLATAGTFTNVYSLTFNSSKNGTSLGGTPQNVTLTVTGVIIVPEPESLVLAGLGIGIAAWLARRK